MRILVFGAGIIGQIYAARLQHAGHDVTVLARGATGQALARDGIILVGAKPVTCRVAVIDRVDPADSYDLVLVTVRRDQVGSALPAVRAIQADRVVFLLNHPTGLAELSAAVGPERSVFGFPGVAGERIGDGAVRYLEVPQQPTTLGRRHGREEGARAALKSAGFAVALTSDMAGWLKTHAVFIAAVGAAINACGGDSAALAADPERMRTLVRAVREGFGSLAAQGVAVTPLPLRVIFTLVPTAFAVRYWRGQLAGEVGMIGLAPHVWRTRDTELAALTADVQELLRGGRATPHLDSLLSG